LAGGADRPLDERLVDPGDDHPRLGPLGEVGVHRVGDDRLYDRQLLGRGRRGRRGRSGAAGRGGPAAGRRGAAGRPRGRAGDEELHSDDEYCSEVTSSHDLLIPTGLMRWRAPRGPLSQRETVRVRATGYRFGLIRWTSGSPPIAPGKSIFLLTPSRLK